MGWVLPITAASLSGAIIVVAIADTGARRLALGYVTGRRAQTVLVCAGVVAATAMFVSASLVADSFAASVRRSVAEQLGPVHEEVVRPGDDPAPLDAAIRGAGVAGVADTLPMVTMAATVRSRNFVARVAQAQILEVDFDAARQFGGVPRETGIAGPTPTGNSAVIAADLADAIAISPTQRVTVYAFGRAQTFSIARVVPRRGIAGIRTPLSPTGSASMNLFVPIGTIRDMARSPSTTFDVRQATEATVVAVANRASVADDTVVEGLRSTAVAARASVRPVRQQLIDDARQRSRPYADLLRAISLVGALVGLGLLLLSLSILSRDRVRAVGALRAYGVGRRRVVTALSLEGWLSSLAGTVVGALVAIAVGAAVVLVARDVFATASAGNIALVYSVPTVTLLRSSAIVFLIALCTVGVTGAAISRQNIVRAVRQLGQPREPQIWRAQGATLPLCAIGVALTAVGFRYANAVAALIGPSIIGIGIVAASRTQSDRRRLVRAASLAVLAWSLIAIAVLPRSTIHVGAALLVTEALIMTGCVVALFGTQLSAGGRLGARSHRLRGLALASNYGLRPSRRSLLVAATYALLLFMLTVIFAARELYQRDTTALARRLGGRSTLEVRSNAASPLPPSEVEQLDGVTRVRVATATPAQLDASSDDATRDVTAVGIDASWIARESPPLAGGGSAARQLATYASVVDDATKILVASDLYADRQSGFPRGAPHVGDRVTLRLPTTGKIRTLTVAGVLAAARYDGSDHVYVGRTALSQLLGPVAPNLLYVETSAAVNADVLAAVIDGTHLPNGTYARSFARLANESNATRTQFLDITAGYASLGLVVAMVGVAVVMIDRVRERQRQIAMLRAFGVPSRVVRRGVRIEGAIIALAGTLTGIACGALFMGQLNRALAIAVEAPSLTLPIVPLALGVVVLVATSMLATAAAGRRVARLQLPESLHVDA